MPEPPPDSLPAIPAIAAREYRPELDALRFLAFLMVFLAHESPGFPIAAFNMGPEAARMVTVMGRGSGTGLCLFFALSAYLITTLLLKEREQNPVISVRKFYLRRVLRIWPLYLFGILLGIAWALLRHHPYELNAFPWLLLFAGNFYFAHFGWTGSPMTPLWSISVEEQFYLLWPWAMRWFSRRGLVVCALSFIAAANLTLFYFGRIHAENDPTVWCNTQVQFQMFAVGILLALARKRLMPGGAAVGALLAILGLVLWFFANHFFLVKRSQAAGMAVSGLSLIAGYALIALGCAAVLHGFCMIGPSHIPRWAASLGKISYGLYVYHFLVMALTSVFLNRLHIHPFSGASAAVSLLVTIVAAKLSYAWLESPFLRLKRRFEIVHSRPI